MALSDLKNWLDEFTGPNIIWYVKRLSGNDTLANQSHQAGPYIPKEFLFSIFPVLNKQEIKNPDVWFNLRVDSHPDQRKIRAIWYNNKFHDNPKKGRNEARLTNFGGASSALLNPDNTGALAVFAFKINKQCNAEACYAWVCRDVAEEDLLEDRVGSIDPGQWKVWTADESNHPDLFSSKEKPRLSCWLEPNKIPPTWREKFPTGAEIIGKTVELRPGNGMDPDKRLVNRRDCEFEIFRSVEKAIELPWIKKGFNGIDDFVARAQTILQRRKSRSGRSLELHAREIFIEEGMREGQDFSYQPESEDGKKPDFLFPSALAYKNKSYPEESLRMLAVKTTCKDRWRQIRNEADRISIKHLLTLQEGVSEGQFREMSAARVKLVVPASLVSSFPKNIQPKLQTFGEFLREAKNIKNSF
jgi:hypothetical protein